MEPPRSLAEQMRDVLRHWTDTLAPDSQTRLATLAAGTNEYGVDPFGLDVEYLLSAMAPFIWMYKHYFRVEVTGLQNLPEGRLLVVANHSGQLPFDGAMIGIALLLEADPPRVIRSMVDNWVPSLPFVSTFMARCGQVVGTPENCKRLLAAGETILVFPEGMKGISKLYRHRYQLQEFGRGFMRLSLDTDTPIVPVAVIGAEEQAPAIANLKSVARLVGLPELPIVPQIVPLPLPVKYRLVFGEPMRFTARASDDADEEADLERKVRVVRARLQSMLQERVAERKHVFW